MAVDEAMLAYADRHRVGLVRLYGWQPYCLSFGRHEPAARRYDRAAIVARGIDVVRRPTGGRAVWHAGELTYALAAPSEAFGTLPEAYRLIHRTVALALQRLGAPATLAKAEGRTPGLMAGACFGGPVGGEVLVDGRKVVGSAQVRAGRAFLQHGSILVDDDQSLVAAVTRGPAGTGTEAPLGRWSRGRITTAEIAAALSSALGEWPGSWCTGAAPPELSVVAEQAAARYRSPEWTWRR